MQVCLLPSFGQSKTIFFSNLMIPVTLLSGSEPNS